VKTLDEYRKRAAFLRTLADQAMTPALRESYIELAAKWDALADEAAGKASKDGFGQGPSQPS
jgi:uncharacterized protein Yka (UPF0111/DUF47 family)